MKSFVKNVPPRQALKLTSNGTPAVFGVTLEFLYHIKLYLSTVLSGGSFHLWQSQSRTPIMTNPASNTYLAFLLQRTISAEGLPKSKLNIFCRKFFYIYAYTVGFCAQQKLPCRAGRCHAGSGWALHYAT